MTETPITDLKAAFVANYETEMAIDVPSQRRAFLGVEAAGQAICLKAIDKRVAAARKAVFAITAGAEGLAVIANEFGVPREPASKYHATCEAVASTGSTVAAGAQLTSEVSGAYYTVGAAADEAGGTVAFAITAEKSGEDANLETTPHGLTFVSPISGVTNDVAITAVTAYGADEEDLEVWRGRVLEAERAAYGGGNAADYRHWAEQVAGVAHAYPYSGKPVAWKETENLWSFDSATRTMTRLGSSMIFDIGTVQAGDMIEVQGSALNDGFYTVQSYAGGFNITIAVVEALADEPAGAPVTIINQSLPGDRAVFVEADDADRIPSESLLDLVRAAITYGIDDECPPAVGDVDSTLYVEPVVTVDFYVEILGLVVDPLQEDECKAKVVEDLTAYFAACRPFITGLDFELDRHDVLTDPSVGAVVQGVLEAFSASSDGVRIHVGSAGADTVTSYQLSQGEVPLLGLVFDTGDSDWSAP